MAASGEREKKRERERRARQRRVANLEQMRLSRHTLQHAVLAVRTLDEDTWERFLNPDTMRVRRFLLAAKQVISLTREQAGLRLLLQQHRLATGAVAQMLSDHTNDDWDRKLVRVREIVQKHYMPRTLQECQIEMEASLREIDAFQWSTDTETTGVQFLGWKERRCVDHARHVLQFQFYKTFRGYDVMDSVNTIWDAYTDGTTFQQVILGHRLRGTLEILQQLGPNALIVRVMERFPATVGDIHVVYLVFRLRTERGYMQCVRSLYCPNLIKAIEEPLDVWPSNLIWKQWEVPKSEENGYQLRIGGSLVGRDANYLNQWMMEVFGCVLRAEHLATKRPLISTG